MADNRQQLAEQAKKVPFSVQISSKGYQALINQTLRDKGTADRFVAAITSTVSANPALQECECSTILSAALLGEGLKLSPSPQLGQYYLVPFKNRKNGCTVATFVLGYKGYIQLAVRSGQYKKLNVLPIKAGELIRYDPLEEEIQVALIQDEREREKAETIGYYAFFEYINGFKKALYWTKEKMVAHAEKYSAGYQAHKGYTFWEKDFDGMACKTMLRQLISKWGIMSIDLQKAYEGDNAVIGMDGTPVYLDTPPQEPQTIIPQDEPPIDPIPAEAVEINLNDL